MSTILCQKSNNNLVSFGAKAYNLTKPTKEAIKKEVSEHAVKVLNYFNPKNSIEEKGINEFARAFFFTKSMKPERMKTIKIINNLCFGVANFLALGYAHRGKLLDSYFDVFAGAFFLGIDGLFHCMAEKNAPDLIKTLYNKGFKNKKELSYAVKEFYKKAGGSINSNLSRIFSGRSINASIDKTLAEMSKAT